MSTEPQLGKYIPLKMATAFFSDETDRSEGDQDRYWLLALRAMVDLNFEFGAEPETFKIPVNANKTANFPTGCLTWSKIGLLNASGEVSTLKINTGLSFLKDTNPNRLNYLTPQLVDSVSILTTAPFFLNYYYNDGYYNLFGAGTGLVQYGECRIDEANELVVLPSDFRYDSILFEGIFAPQREEDYKIPLAFLEAVIAFIKAKLKMDTMQNYYGEATKARRRWGKKKVTLQMINQVIRESESMKLRS